MKTVIYPGTFDPVTHGHLDIIKRASKLFDRVIVAVSSSLDKSTMFSYLERIEMMNLAVEGIDHVEVRGFENLMVDFAKSVGADVAIRGLRAVSDFEYELQIGYANESLDPAVETLYLMPSLQYAFISSSVVRSILRHGGPVAHLMPEKVVAYIQQRQGK